MNLKEILSVSGRSGLFKVVAQTKNGAIVESLTDKKRFPVFVSDKISTLADISIFCKDEDMPLKDVLKKIFEKEEGKACINHNESNDKLKTYFESVLPEYDKEKVYVSDIKKITNWYNLLLENNMLVFDEPKDEENETNENETLKENEEKPPVNQESKEIKD